MPAVLSVSPKVSHFQRNLYSNIGRSCQSTTLRNPEKPFLSREGYKGSSPCCTLSAPLPCRITARSHTQQPHEAGADTEVLALKPCLALSSRAGNTAADQKRHLLFV